MSGYAAQEFSLRVGGRHIAALAWGRSDDPPVLALHGWLDNAASFSLLAPRLMDLRVVAVDLPGHGRSDHNPPGFAYHFVDWVRVVAGVADALHWDRFAIVGHSMGAGIGSLFAGTFPARVRALVLLDGLGPLTEDPQMSPQRLAAGIEALHRVEAQERRRHHFPTVEAAAARMCEAVPGLQPASARLLAERGLRAEQGGFAWQSDSRLRVSSLWRLTDAHVEAFFRRIECPCLLVRASAGWPFDPQWAQHLVRCLPAAWTAEVDGPHHLHLDAASDVADLVNPFLRFAP